MSNGQFAGSERDIDIWLAFYDEMAEATLAPGLRALLSDEELSRARRFHFDDDRKRYLVTRALVRSVLSRYAPIAPELWTFSTNSYGRPEIANDDPAARELRFNVSHTRGLIAVGVARGRALGVDVENIRERDVAHGVAERFFSPLEAAELARVPAHRRRERFFEYWTFKESYVKARGMGLSIPLDKFSFDYPHGSAVRMAIQPELGDDAGRWIFWQYRPTDDYLLAICAERNQAPVPRVHLRKLSRSAVYEPFALPLSKMSA